MKKNYLKKKININKSSWVKKWSIFYALLKVSKKKIKQNLISFKPNFFYIALLPILGYALDQKNSFAFCQGPGYSKASGGFLNKTLPGVNNFSSINSSKLSWETFSYTNYFKKIKWNTVNKINYFDGSIFISFNANSKLCNKQYYIGTYKKKFQSNNVLSLNLKSKTNNNDVLNFNNSQSLNVTDVKPKSNTNTSSTLNSKHDKTNFKKFFLSGRYYNKFFKNYYIEPNNFKTNLLKSFDKLSYWQNYFLELDHIPTKLNNIYFFPFEQNLKTKTTLLQNPPLLNSNTKQNPFYLDAFNQKDSETKITRLQLFNTIEKQIPEHIDVENQQLTSNNKFSASNKPSISEQSGNKLKNQTSIEKQNNQLNIKISTQNIQLWNRRLFQYKIDNNIFLFRNFLNDQINNFNNDEQKVLNSRFGFSSKNNFTTKKLQNINFALQNDDWKIALRNDVRNFGNTEIS